jgi:hypothetical protein
MATWTEFDSATTQNTANQNTYSSGNIAPSVGQLLRVVVIASGTTANDATVTAAANGVSTFHPVGRATFGPTIHSVYEFIADQFTTGTATMTVTFNCSSDQPTGAIVLVSALNGMERAGSAAVRSVGGTPQVSILNNGAGASVPAFPALGANVLTTNPTGYALGEISTAGVLNPTGWTQGASGGYSTPTIGGAYGYRNSGFTGTAPTWPGNETAHGGLFVEYDASPLAVVEQSDGPGFPI